MKKFGDFIDKENNTEWIMVSFPFKSESHRNEYE